MRIGCLGMATLDTLLYTPAAVFAEEAVTPVEEVVVSPGGKGIVTAIAMREAEADVLPFSLLGKGSELAELLPGSLDSTYLLPRLGDDNRTWITISKAHKVVTFIARGVLDDSASIDSLVRSFVQEVDALYVTIEEVSVLAAALEAASEAGVPLALNPSLPLLSLAAHGHGALLEDLVRQSRIVICNDWEAPRLLDALGVGDWSDLQGSALEEVVVTAGSAGGRYAVSPFRDWQKFEATPAGRLCCVVGAGDTFNGGYLTARLAAGATPEESCRRGADLAALKVAHKGSALPTGSVPTGS